MWRKPARLGVEVDRLGKGRTTRRRTGPLRDTHPTCALSKLQLVISACTPDQITGGAAYTQSPWMIYRAPKKACLLACKTHPTQSEIVSCTSSAFSPSCSPSSSAHLYLPSLSPPQIAWASACSINTSSAKSAKSNEIAPSPPSPQPPVGKTPKPLSAVNSPPCSDSIPCPHAPT